MSLGARRSMEAGHVMNVTMATICTPNVSVSIYRLFPNTDSGLRLRMFLGLENKFYWCHWSDVVKDITRPIIIWSERSSSKVVTPENCPSSKKQWNYFLCVRLGHRKCPSNNWAKVPRWIGCCCSPSSWWASKLQQILIISLLLWSTSSLPQIKSKIYIYLKRSDLSSFYSIN